VLCCSFIRSSHVAIPTKLRPIFEDPMVDLLRCIEASGIWLFINTQHIPMQSPRPDTFVANVEAP
jgi:hypothetical protein